MLARDPAEATATAREVLETRRRQLVDACDGLSEGELTKRVGEAKRVHFRLPTQRPAASTVARTLGLKRRSFTS